ncbi:GCN5-related N-acetyltransferase [Desulfosarcina variabilis str. Montpellier]|uniref:GNAT family N-acetyltransferase n=1 Tax=Desulfosarcina variabilis TaxID=2300 RepID=UPI003AFA41F2
MDKNAIHIRMMTADDFDAVVRIDKKVLNVSRPDYYTAKFEKLFKSVDYLPTSLVAEDDAGTVVGFVMGELFMGEYGIFKQEATLDTIGIDPDYQQRGIGKLLIKEFLNYCRRVGVKKLNTLVNLDDSKMIHFFNKNAFTPSKTVNLECNL